MTKDLSDVPALLEKAKGGKARESLVTGPTKAHADRCITHHYACDCREWEHACEVERLEAALEAAQGDACVALVADIRFACGDNGKRMQPELVEFIRGLARDAARYRFIADDHGSAWEEELDAAIAAAEGENHG